MNKKLALIVDFITEVHSKEIGCMCCADTNEGNDMVGRLNKAIVAMLNALLSEEEKLKYATKFQSCYEHDGSGKGIVIKTVVGGHCISKSGFIATLKEIMT
ncbi:MAG TPA: hypothetical protein P5096_00545 [Patescibacteria group bacterium]|nr:hypothetical protein [Patescibacteria group bacterium]